MSAKVEITADNGDRVVARAERGGVRFDGLPMINVELVAINGTDDDAERFLARVSVYDLAVIVNAFMEKR